MKKIILSAALIFIGAMTYAQESIAVNTNTTYTYYPNKNIYYNSATGDYLYYDNPTRSWIAVSELPSSYIVDDKMNHYPILYNGTDVWKENRKHTKMYKVKRDGSIKVRSNEDVAGNK